MTPPRIKRLLYIQRKAPYGSVHAQEALETALIGAAFNQRVALAFLDDGVLQLVAGQDPRELGIKHFSPAYRALGDHGIERIYVERESLDERGLTVDDLMRLTATAADGVERPSIRLVDRAGMRAVMDAHDVLLTF